MLFTQCIYYEPIANFLERMWHGYLLGPSTDEMPNWSAGRTVIPSMFPCQPSGAPLYLYAKAY